MIDIYDIRLRSVPLLSSLSIHGHLRHTETIDPRPTIIIKSIK